MNNLTIRELENKYPFITNYLEDNKLDTRDYKDSTFKEYLKSFTEEDIEDWAIAVNKLEEDLLAYIDQMKEFLGIQDEIGIKSLTILPGFNKSGEKEDFEEITLHKSEIISIVGPTGSGKSRLLGDIEWTAQGDTPTGRGILINGEIPDKKWRFSINNKLVAQLSQNMNFVMDLSVQEFLELHAESRLVEDVDSVVAKIIEAANNLAG